MRKISSGLMVLALACSSMLTGCNPYQDAQNSLNVVGQVIAIAKADLPPLCATGEFNSVECAAVQSFINVAGTLEGQAVGCVTSLGTSAKKTAILVCVNSFATGLLSASELNGLRILNPTALRQVQVWVTAIVLALNATLAIVGGTANTPPAISPTPATSMEIEGIRQRLLLPRGA